MPERAPPSDPFELCGTTIEDKYRVSSIVGAGGFGVVYRGEHTGFGEPIAVKCLKLSNAPDESQRAELLRRLQDEGRVLHRLSKLSSGIVQALDVGAIVTPNGQWVPYLVLEWLDGQSLAAFYKERAEQGSTQMPLREAVDLLEPAARALAVAHRQKVAHRDVKPENLFLTKVHGEQTLKLLDFGIAKALAGHTRFTAAPAATEQHPGAFTPRYGAPEQFNKKRGATGPWTDVFALALILVELVSGERALDGDDATQLYIAAADPAARPTLRYHGIDAPDAVETVLLRALAVDPHDRYLDAGSFWSALRKAVGKQATGESKRAGLADDLSDTAQFVTRHDIDLEPGALSGDASQPAAARGSAAATSAEQEPLGDSAEGAAESPSGPRTLRSPEGGAGGAVAAAGSSGAGSAAGSGERQASPTGSEAGAGGAGSGETKRSTALGSAHSGAAGVGDTQPSGADPAKSHAAEPPPARRSPWMTIVAIAALLGAAVLYSMLRQEQQTPSEDDTAAGTAQSGGWTAASALPPGVGGAGRLPLPALDATADGPAPSESSTALRPEGGAGGAGGAAGGGGQGGLDEPIPLPEDMVLIRLSDPAATDRPVGFLIDRHEVSTRGYQQCVQAGRCPGARRVVLEETARGPREPDETDAALPTVTPAQRAETWRRRCNAVRGELDHPMNCVNHASAEDFCRWKGRRLPTSEEWTRAAAGPDGRRYPWGTDEPDCTRACFGLNGSCRSGDRPVATCPLGSHAGDRAAEGAIDMAGNVGEWVQDAAPELTADGVSYRIVRGGSFYHEADRLESAATTAVPPATAHVYLGFRCAMDLPEGYADPPAEPKLP